MQDDRKDILYRALDVIRTLKQPSIQIADGREIIKMTKRKNNESGSSRKSCFGKRLTIKRKKPSLVGNTSQQRFLVTLNPDPPLNSELCFSGYLSYHFSGQNQDNSLSAFKKLL